MTASPPQLVTAYGFRYFKYQLTLGLNTRQISNTTDTALALFSIHRIR
jgi:hypothetical protein